jgi:hypothetical protein
MGCVVRRFPFLIPDSGSGQDDRTDLTEMGAKRLKILHDMIMNTKGDRSGKSRKVLGYFCLSLLLLLPLNSFAQAHLWKHRPFRAADTDHSGGDHLCSIRRDSDGDGRPERLGDYVLATGTVIAGPSTYETGGWIFWVRDRTCGMMIYGEQETLAIGDSVDVVGWVRLTNGNYFFPETGFATLGDVAIENAGVTLRGRGHNHRPLCVLPASYCCEPEAYGGNLIKIEGLHVTMRVWLDDGDVLIRLAAGEDSLLLYIDRDIQCAAVPQPGMRVCVTGIVTRMRVPTGFASSPSWCVAPRSSDDILIYGCSPAIDPICWGEIKAGFYFQD